MLSPHLANLRTLILHSDRHVNGHTAPDETLVAALQSPHRANLEELAVNVDGLTRGPSVVVLHALAASPHLRKLRKLNLSCAGDDGPTLDAATVRLLGQSPNLAGLEELNLSGAAFPLDVWDEVLKWPCLPRLKTLRLYNAWQVGPDNRLVAHLADAPEYRQAFERLVPAVDWLTENLTPSSGGDCCWHGQTRERRRY